MVISRLILGKRDLFVQRHEEAQKFLSHSQIKGVYTVLTGPDGCGKTNLLLDIVHNQTGIVYVLYEPGRFFEKLRGAFGLSLQSEMLPASLSYIFGPYLSYINWELGNDVADTIRFLTDVIVPEAAAYRARTGKPFVLIIDDIEKMLDQVNGIADFHELQFILKIIADSLVMHVVLVESSGEVISRLVKQRSEASRMSVEEVGDIDRESSIYLLSRPDIKEMGVSASEVYEVVTGGRLLMIWAAVNCIRGHIP